MEFQFDLKNNDAKTYVTLESKKGTFKSKIELYILSEKLAKSIIPKIAREISRKFDSRVIHDCYDDTLNPAHAVLVENGKSFLIQDEGIENDRFSPVVVRELGVEN